MSVAQAGDEVRIAVTDSGRGLEPEQRERLARRWTQGMAGLQLGAGSGLGLAIASRYATLMGGRLTLESGPGERGLCATVHLGTAEPTA